MNRVFNVLIGIQLVAISSIAAQSDEKKEIIKISDQIFAWEVADNVDALENIFHDSFIVMGSDGAAQSKKEYITLLRSGNFVHNDIEVFENTATVNNNTATVFGKGRFKVTVYGEQITVEIHYIEVFTRPDTKSPWKIIAMHAGELPAR